MKIGITIDAYEDAITDKLFSELDNKEKFFKWFNKADYGNDEVEIFMVVVCSPKELKLRKRYDSKDKVLYWDVMLDYKIMKKAKKQEKRKILADAIIDSFDVLGNYKKLGIDKEGLKADAIGFFKSIEWLKNN